MSKSEEVIVVKDVSQVSRRGRKELGGIFFVEKIGYLRRDKQL